MGATTSTVRSVNDGFDLVDAYVRTIRAPHAPSNLNGNDVAAGRTLFINNNCGACHGTSDWTISRVFYTPNETNNGQQTSATLPPTMVGLLRSSNYMLPSGYPAALNPPAAGGMATLRFNSATVATQNGNDQINCILRNVGTFPATLDGMQSGLVVTGAPRLREVRTDMTTVAQGGGNAAAGTFAGFNPPSLFGMSTGAPYFHGGNARTLEELFDSTFSAHYKAHSAIFLDVTGQARTDQVRQIVAFLLSIDESTQTVTPMQGGLTFNPDLCPVTFP